MHPSKNSADGVVCAIPARWSSVRLPGKPLLPLAGRPMIEHVYERAARARGLARVVVLTDDERILEAVAAFGGDAEMTPPDCASGTDRIAWAARSWSAAAIVNVQGDEPLLDPALVTAVAEHLTANPDDPMVTLATPADPGDAADPAKVKVVCDREGYALYFSRAAIPFPRSPVNGRSSALRHVGIYGYQHQALARLAQLEPTLLERTEGLEQLRALENGMRIRVLETAHSGFGVDTVEDLERASNLLAELQSTGEHSGRRWGGASTEPAHPPTVRTASAAPPDATIRET